MTLRTDHPGEQAKRNSTPGSWTAPAHWPINLGRFSRKVPGPQGGVALGAHCVRDFCKPSFSMRHLREEPEVIACPSFVSPAG